MATIDKNKHVATITFTVAENARLYRTYDIDPLELDADERAAILSLVKHENIDEETDPLAFKTLERLANKYRNVVSEDYGEADEPNMNYMLDDIYYEED